MSNKPKCLITGALGFIGSNLLRKAVYEKQQYTFITLDKAVLPSSLDNMYFNKAVSNNHLADITDAHTIDRIFQFEKPDYVLHLAAESAVDYSLTDPNKFITTNVLGTQNLINASLKYNVKKFIYISTDECYGQLTSESEPSWTEESPLNPRNPYSASKAAGELLVKAAHESHGLAYNITRSSNNYGPRQTSEKLIPRVIKCILDKQPIPVYGQGMQIRDWTHVIDNCAGLLTVLNNGEDNQTYNISANQELTNIEVVNKICNIMGEGHSLITFIPDPRKSHDFRYSVNCDKIKKLGWEPKIKFKEGIDEQCVQWFLNNKWALRN